MKVSFWNRKTGEFRKGLWSLSRSMVALNTPEGFEAIEGHFDHITQRVDVENLPDGAEPRDYVVAIAEPKRDERIESVSLMVAAQRRIEALELGQLRPMRELAIDPSNQMARTRLQQIETEIAEKRLEIARRRDVLSSEEDRELAQKA